jgi:hypothetical protein
MTVWPLLATGPSPRIGVARPAKAQPVAEMIIESIAGPAFATAVPVSTKMPVPMIDRCRAPWFRSSDRRSRPRSASAEIGNAFFEKRHGGKGALCGGPGLAHEQRDGTVLARLKASRSAGVSPVYREQPGEMTWSQNPAATAILPKRFETATSAARTRCACRT